MDRRDFLKRGALGIAGAIVGGSVIGSLAGLTTSCAPAAGKKRIGLQLYSLREAMGQDPKATLTAIAEMGYTDLETANYADGKVYGFTPAEFRTFVEGLGMKVESCHIGGGRVPAPEEVEERMSWWRQAIADHKAMGCKYIVVPSFRMGSTIEDLAAVCAYFNQVAAMCKAEGIVFGYHNHSSEFRSIDGQVIYDYMLANTSADVVYEMDVYWVQEGGQSPVAYLQKYAGRFPVLHIKDDDIIGASGKMDFEAIFNAAYAQGTTDYYVEVEKYPLPAEVCVQNSFNFLDVAPFVK
ncbi:MAG: sugar phosphate isomerase/epimerase [Alistipes sp.]|jgi:sugar phosphate isomerase/epimerase|nr:sugar phosphate isomerase/epimerase [Alistipes sp.]